MLQEAAASSPLYARVQAALAGRIGRDYRPGDLLPTQQELAQEFGASLITVKRALAELARAGLVESTRGRGTVVRRPSIPDDRRGQVSSWTESMTELGSEPRTAWTRLEQRAPDPVVARLLRLRARQQVVVVQRLRLLDGEPICLMTNELPARLVPGLAGRGLTDESLYATLARVYGLVPAAADEEVSARPATAQERWHLGSATRHVLQIERHSFLADGCPLERSLVVAPASRYRYRVQVTRPARPLRKRSKNSA